VRGVLRIPSSHVKKGKIFWVEGSSQVIKVSGGLLSRREEEVYLSFGRVWVNLLSIGGGKGFFSL